jgi:predicted nucleotidyltransferase
MSFEPYFAAWKDRWRRERREVDARGAMARARAEAVAQMLRAEFGVTRVVLFGSLARGEGHAHSDIDLAVSGLDQAARLRAEDRAAALAPEFEVDLVPLDSASPALLDDIRRDGVELGSADRAASP